MTYLKNIHKSSLHIPLFSPSLHPFFSADLQLDELVDVELLHRPIISMPVRAVGVYVCVEVNV